MKLSENINVDRKNVPLTSTAPGIGGIISAEAAREDQEYRIDRLEKIGRRYTYNFAAGKQVLPLRDSQQYIKKLPGTV